VAAKVFDWSIRFRVISGRVELKLQSQVHKETKYLARSTKVLIVRKLDGLNAIIHWRFKICVHKVLYRNLDFWSLQLSPNIKPAGENQWIFITILYCRRDKKRPDGLCWQSTKVLICILDPLCTSAIKHKGSFLAPATQRRVHKRSSFLNIAFICNTSLLYISPYARLLQNKVGGSGVHMS